MRLPRYVVCSSCPRRMRGQALVCTSLTFHFRPYLKLRFDSLPSIPVCPAFVNTAHILQPTVAREEHQECLLRWWRFTTSAVS